MALRCRETWRAYDFAAHGVGDETGVVCRMVQRIEGVAVRLFFASERNEGPQLHLGDGRFAVVVFRQRANRVVFVGFDQVALNAGEMEKPE